MKLILKSEQKELTQITSLNHLLFSIIVKYTDNDIGDEGATSVSEALKSNTTLTEVNLRCENERNNTQIACISRN